MTRCPKCRVILSALQVAAALVLVVLGGCVATGQDDTCELERSLHRLCTRRLPTFFPCLRSRRCCDEFFLTNAIFVSAPCKRTFDTGGIYYLVPVCWCSVPLAGGLAGAVLNASKVFEKAPQYFARRFAALYILDVGIVISSGFVGLAMLRKRWEQNVQCGANDVVWSLLCLAFSIAQLATLACLCCKSRADDRSPTVVSGAAGEHSAPLLDVAAMSEQF